MSAALTIQPRYGLALILPFIAVISLSIALGFADLELTTQTTDRQIFWQLRLPMLLTAVMVGAALATSAAVLQVLLQNPLADPGIIGISSGASLAAALYLLTGLGNSLFSASYGLPLAAFVGALLSTLFIYLLARRLSGLAGIGVILAGIAISTLSGAIVAWLYFFTDAQSLRNLTFWLMGSLHQADRLQVSVAAVPLLLALAWTLAQGRQLNWLYFGVQSARLAGLNEAHFFRLALLASAVLVAIAVSLAGSIAFVGLLVPHLLRQWFGHDNRLILPASALYGALLMLLVLWISRLFGGVTVPVSMLTATLGGPVFLLALIKLARQS